MAEFTSEFLNKLKEQQSKDAATVYLSRVHGGELAQGQFDVQRYEAMDENQRLAFMVQLRRGHNVDLAASTIALVVAFGAGALCQNWFPYQSGKVPLTTTVIGGLTWAVGTFGLKRSYAMRSTVALSGVTFALGGSLGRSP